MQDKRALVLTRLVAGKVDEAEAALLLGLSPRSIRRLRARLLAHGLRGLVHGNTGRAPAHRLDPAVAARVIALARTTYAGCNDSHLAELLAEREGITLSRASVERRWARGHADAAATEDPRWLGPPRVAVREHLDCTVAPRLRVHDHTRAPLAGAQPLPRNIDRSHPWRQWQGGFSKRTMRRANGA